MNPEQDVVIDLLNGSIKPEGACLFPWVPMKPEVPEDYPDQFWLLRGDEGSALPGVTLGVFGRHLLRIDLGFSISLSHGASCRADLSIDPAKARALAEALLSAAAIFEERLAAAQKGGVA